MNAMEDNKQPHEDELQPILQSIKGMQRAKAPDSIFGRVLSEMNRPVAKIVPMSRLSLAAACMVALIGLNIAVLLNKQNTTTDSATRMIEYYGTSAQYGYSY